MSELFLCYLVGFLSFVLGRISAQSPIKSPETELLKAAFWPLFTVWWIVDQLMPPKKL